MTTLPVPPSALEAARLQRRAQAVARLRHPNLVRMLPLPGGAGLAPVLGSARRLADFTLPAGTFKRFDLEQVVRLLIDVLNGLSALHEVTSDGEQFVHGCVSPQHIYVDEHGTARLVPLLPAHFSPNAKLERTGYVAPERLLGKPVDVRADVFSVGVMLWEALAGKRLSADGSLACLLAPGQRPPAIRLAPRLGWARPLCAIAERAIALDPITRFATALELSQALERAAAKQLARVDSDTWQEEAPTPVFHPAVHLAKLRTSTPPPAVLTLPAAEAPASAATEDLVAEAAPAIVEGSRRSGRGRAVVFGLGALTLGFAAVVLPSRLQRSPAPSPPLAAAVAPFPAVAAPPSSAPSGVSAVSAPSAVAAPAPSAVAAPAPSVASAPSAAPAPSVSARSPRPKHPGASPKNVAPTGKAPVKPRAPGDDYGI